MEIFSKELISGFLLVSLVAVSSGCVSMTVTQDLEMDGTSDFEIEAEGNELALSKLESRLKSSRIALENAEKQRKEGYFNYSFYDVPAESITSGGMDGIELEADYERDKGIIYDRFRIELDSPGMEKLVGGSTGFSGFVSDSGSLEYRLNYFGSLEDTNGKVIEKDDEKYVLMDLTEEKSYYVEFKAFKPHLVYANLVSNGGCRPELDCGNQSGCEGQGEPGSCDIAEGCEDYMFEPVKARTC